MKLTAKQIERLVKQGEVAQTECKDASGGLPDSLWESYSSFANTDGGVILLGVKEVDHKFSIAGVPKAAMLIKQFWDGVNNREKVNVNILFDRHVYVVEKRFNEIQVSNLGTMRISKEVAIEGGRSDPRNAQVFNIFSLIGIGERSGMGLSNLYALWEQHGFETPVIREEFDPEKTIVSISTGLDNNQTINEADVDNKSALMSNLDNNSKVPQVGPSSARNRPKLDPKSAQGAPRSDQDPTKVPQGRPKGDPRVTQGDPRVTQGDPSLMQDLPAAAKQVFRELVQDPKMTLRGLATKLGFSKTTVTTAIGILVAKKIIRREGNKQTGHWEVMK